MDARAKIPALALLGLQFTAGCEDADPIVGTWSATQIHETVYPQEMMYDETSFRATVELRVGEDLTGVMASRDEVDGPDVDYYEASEFDLVVTPEGAKYRIEVQYGTYGGYGEATSSVLVLDCELAADRLRCTGTTDNGHGPGPETEYRWARKAGG